jgi:hypothetical protein
MFGWLRRAPPMPSEDQLQLQEALVGYPPYAPPALNPDPSAFADVGLAYKDFFLASRESRLEALGGFLAKFDVSLSPDDAGLMAVSAWLPRYADLLVDDLDDDTVQDAYRAFTLPWTGALAGLNPIFDLGIYYAECLWRRRTRLRWIVYRSPDYGSAVHIIEGLPHGRGFDPMHWMYTECRNIRNSRPAKRKRWLPDDDPVFLGSDRFYTHVLSRCPPGRRSRKL